MDNEKNNDLLIKNIYKSIFYTGLLLLLGTQGLSFIFSPIFGQDDLGLISTLLTIIIFLLVFLGVSFMGKLKNIEKLLEDRDKNY